MTVLYVVFVCAGAALLYYLAARVLFADLIRAARERDPAATGAGVVVFTYSGFHAVVSYRIAHALWRLRLRLAARALSMWARWLTGIEIHPGARIGSGLFIDHGMGVVVGETAIIGNDVTLFQGVTLGGTGKQKGKRHPTLGDKVVVGAGAKILGNTTVGNNVLVGANAVIVRDVPADSTVVGVPGRVTRRRGQRLPQAVSLEHTSLPDPVQQSLGRLRAEIEALEREMHGRKHPGADNDAPGG